eukprot:GHVU01016410.1.p4 GENE.GHVU01016410.1~~GHVU01016410.1.p4  ORF type:complete len:102 (+),score=7.43 GHVU01016410.1:465-770(+)
MSCGVLSVSLGESCSFVRPYCAHLRAKAVVERLADREAPEDRQEPVDGREGPDASADLHHVCTHTHTHTHTQTHTYTHMHSQMQIDAHIYTRICMHGSMSE